MVRFSLEKEKNMKKIPVENEVRVVLDFLVDAIPFEDLPKAEAVFVAGHSDPRVINHACEIWCCYLTNKIIITGGNRKTNPVPNGFASETEFQADKAKGIGLTCWDLILEDGQNPRGMSSNTLQNVIFGMQSAYRAKFSPRSLIVVAMPPLLRRLRATFAKQFPQIETVGSSFWFDSLEWIDSPRKIKRINAEIDRLLEYAEKGDIDAIDIPPDVLSAHDEIDKYFRHISICA